MAHRLLGHEAPRSDRLADALREICRPPRAVRPPIPVEALRAILHACHRDGLAVRDRALVLVTLFADLRFAEALTIDCADVARVADGYVINLHPSEDREACQRRLFPQDNRALCPVHALDAWFDQRREHLSGSDSAPMGGALFVGVRLGAGATFSLGKRIRLEDVRRILKRRCAAAGVDPAVFATHALRIDPSEVALAFGAALPTTGKASA
jgi:site-specific recombinase XerC